MGHDNTTPPYYSPPDVSVAVGPNHVETINSRMVIWDKAGNLVKGPVNLSDFFHSVATPFDPKIAFDPLSSRFFFVVAGIYGDTGHARIAASQTDDPTGAWNQWLLTTENGTFPDYPALGFSSDKVTVTANRFTIADDSFVGAELWVLNKSELISAAGSLTTYTYGPDRRHFTLQPAESQSATATQYLVEAPRREAGFTLWQITGVPNVSAVSATLTTSAARAFVNPPGARQPGARSIDTGDMRLLRATWRNGSLWTAANVGCYPSGGKALRACARVIEINTGSSPWTIRQDFDFGEAGYDYSYPALQTNPAGDLAVVFSRSSSTEYGGLHYAVRRVSDPLNSLSQSALLQAGTGPYDCTYWGSENRWGDYSGAAVDPYDGSLWLAGEYSDTAGASVRNYGTYIARVQRSTAHPDLVWYPPVDPAARFTWSTGQTLPIRFGYFAGDGSFIHDESVVIVISGGPNLDEPVTSWVYGYDIAIDDGARTYAQDFMPSLYGLAPGDRLAIQVFMRDGSVRIADVELTN
jgi:hypothetical protein